MYTQKHIDEWANGVRAAIAARDGDTLANLMQWNDRNGCFTYADSCIEFGETTREEWLASLIRCADDMLANLDN
jgi:hypothetical protein